MVYSEKLVVVLPVTNSRYSEKSAHPAPQCTPPLVTSHSGVATSGLVSSPWPIALRPRNNHLFGVGAQVCYEYYYAGCSRLQGGCWLPIIQLFLLQGSIRPRWRQSQKWTYTIRCTVLQRKPFCLLTVSPQPGTWLAPHD